MNNNRQIDLSTVMTHALYGVKTAMEKVREAQGKEVQGVRTKADQTIVTDTDLVAAKVARLHLEKIGIPLVSEDGVKDAVRAGQPFQFLDPLDGTNAFACGLATSTIIWGLCDPKGKILATIIGEPATGRIWSTTSETSTRMETGGQTILTTVSDKRNLKDSTVFIDVSHGFTRNGRQILTDSQVSGLFSLLSTETKILMPGSNGLMHALVANGGRVVGSITTALGGPWDALGALLVKQAGGVALAFSVSRDTVHQTILEKSNPLFPCTYDLLICAASQAIADELFDTLYIATKGCHGTCSCDEPDQKTILVDKIVQTKDTCPFPCRSCGGDLSYVKARKITSKCGKCNGIATMSHRFVTCECGKEFPV